MPVPLTDEQLAAIASDPDLLAKYQTKLTSDERRRMAGVRPQMDRAANGPRVPVTDQTVGQAVSGAMTDPGPVVGATVGSLAGGVPGAAIGGAAGRGYQTLIEHAGEIPGAVRDVMSGLVNQPAATLRGAMSGMVEGAADAGISGAVGGVVDAAGGLAMRAIRPVMKAVVDPVAQAVYRGYLKPSLAAGSRGKAQEIVRTAIAEGIPISNRGTAKAQTLIDALNHKVDALIKASGDRVDLKSIANDVRAWARQEYYKPGVALDDYDAAMAVADRIDRHPSLNIPPGVNPSRIDVPMPKAQEVKRGLQRSANYESASKRSAENAAEKRGAATARTTIESKVPAVAPLNARESRLLDTMKAVKAAVEREKNQNALVGVKSVLSVGAGGVEYGRTGDPAAAAAKGLALRLALTPAVASRMALYASRFAAQAPAVPADLAARLAYAVLQDEGEQQGAQE